MAEKEKNGFKTIETDMDELNNRLRERRKMMLKRAVEIILLVVVCVIGVEMIYALRSYDTYEIRNAIERKSGSATQYTAFQDSLLEYSNDGISYIGRNNEVMWNQSFEMISPQIEICNDYIAVFDAGGTEIFIMTPSGLKKEIETTSPIQKVCIAKQGTIAVLMKEDGKSLVKLFDVKGTELANGVFYDKKGGLPIDIALSYDATKLAVDMINVNGGKISTTISFFNFDAVGQSEIDNKVGEYTFEGIVIPEIDYVSESKMIAMGTGKFIVFDGSQKPEVSREILVEQEILSFFHNDSYVGIVYDNVEDEKYCHVKVMDFRGRTVMENDISIIYDEIEFLSNNEICVRNASECEIFTTHSIKKFSYTFDKELYKILSSNNAEIYTFIFKDTIEEVKIK